MVKILRNLLFLDVVYLIYNRILFHYKKVILTDFPSIRGRIYIYGQGNILLGQNISINSGKKYNPIGGDTRMTVIVKSGAELSIGHSTGISNTTIVCYERITIGDFVKIGGSVKIYDTDFHSLDMKLRQKRDTDIPINKPITIGDHSFIGAHSIILKGVNIGKNCIVGAGSVVTKSIPDNEIWAGNPAKFIKKVSS